ncbi:flippase [Marinobacterium lutimaris]|uniref:Membrane protein involved in the export of O-antigen and teichoic acid n=1 Tax=Marinobacterium lutimaris TaxID=568106 RepID=A0A1H6B9H7_9GAMM|nr:flippase [Marinobacterium lutimaris]SEG57312.1 Membrane protein involved in the export of O-antigen and teichoic acid [Marinobacterium lutimaris]
MSIRKNTLYNLVGSIIPIAVSLITIPIYISVIGESRYGILAIAWLLLGYFGLFDLGLGRATAQRIAMLSSNKRGERSETFWTALTINSIFGVLGAAIMWPVALFFFGRQLSVDDVLKPEIVNSVYWLALAVPIATMSGVFSGTLQGLSKFLELNVISVCGTALLQIIPLAVAVLHGPDLKWLLPVTIITRVFVAAMLFQRCYSHLLKRQGVKVSKELSGKLFQFGGWVTVSSVIGPMMVILDRFVIGALLGAKYVTYYTVPFQLAERTTVIPVALSSAMFPRLASSGSGEHGRLLTDKALRSLAIIITPLFLLGILSLEWFFELWVGENFASKSTFIGQILLLGFWTNAIAMVPHALLQASGKPDIVAKCHLAEVVPYFLLLYFGLEYIGILGAAIAFSTRAFADTIILLFNANMLKSSVKVLALPVMLMFFSMCLVILNYTFWLVVGVVSALFFVYIYWVSKNIPEELLRFLEQVFKRKWFF